MHLDVAFSTLFDLLTTPRLLFLMTIAVPMGIFFGSTPGLGGKLCLVLLIPFVATLSGANFLKGMIVGLFGLMCAFIGLDPSTGSPRFTFGQLWLWDGLSVIVAVLAMFAVPEMISLGVKGRSFDVSPEHAAALQKSGAVSAAASSPAVRYSQIWHGMWDVVQHKWLVLRCSLL